MRSNGEWRDWGSYFFSPIEPGSVLLLLCQLFSSATAMVCLYLGKHALKLSRHQGNSQSLLNSYMNYNRYRDKPQTKSNLGTEIAHGSSSYDTIAVAWLGHLQPKIEAQKSEFRSAGLYIPIHGDWFFHTASAFLHTSRQVHRKPTICSRFLNTLRSI